MLYVWLSQYIADSAGFVYQSAGILNYNVTPDMVNCYVSGLMICYNSKGMCYPFLALILLGNLLMDMTHLHGYMYVGKARTLARLCILYCILQNTVRKLSMLSILENPPS